MDKLYEKSETGCCLKFDPAPWDEKEKTFKNKLFLKDKVICLFHIPLNFGQVMVKNIKKIMDAGAVTEEPLMLTTCDSLWTMDVNIAVKKVVPNAEMTKISGTFLTKVFEGHYKDSGKWTEEMKKFVESKNKEMKKTYFFYTTCPKCAEHYGKNYTVILVNV
ncbi:MAG: hydrolase [Candidatus Micrarchaeota archaeon]